MVASAILTNNQIPQRYHGESTYLFGQRFHKGNPQEQYNYIIRRVGDPVVEVHDLSLTVMVDGVNDLFVKEVLQPIKNDICDKGYNVPPYKSREQVLDAVIKELSRKS